MKVRAELLGTCVIECDGGRGWIPEVKGNEVYSVAYGAGTRMARLYREQASFSAIVQYLHFNLGSFPLRENEFFACIACKLLSYSNYFTFTTN